MASGILVSRIELEPNPRPLQWKCRVLTTGQPGNSMSLKKINVFLKLIYVLFYFWLPWVFVAARWLPLAAESRGHSSFGMWASHSGRLSCYTASLGCPRLSTCGAGAQAPCGMWGAPEPGTKSVSPELWGELPATGPPGKSLPGHS